MYVDDAVIETIAGSSKVVPYLDMPLQHINDNILRLMARRVTRRKTEELLAKLREQIPGLVVRTTMITGFPGETDAQFEELVDFVRTQRFERLGVFTYSLEPDTPAASLPGHLPETVKESRRSRLMQIQQQNSFAWNQHQVGQQIDVLLDLPVEGEPDAWIGRWYADAPDVDSVTYVTGKNLATGKFVRCEVVGHRNYDLIAAAVDSPR